MSAPELFCEQCGTRIGPTAAFCGSCGAPTGHGAKPVAGPPQAQVPLPPPPAGPLPGPSVSPPGPPAGWGAPPPIAGGTPPPYGPPPGPPPGVAAAAGGAAAGRPSIASQLPSLAQLAAQADYIAIIGGVIVAVAIVLPVYASVSLISLPIWMLFTPLLLAAGPIIVGFLRRNGQVGTQFAIATYLSFGALQATTYWGYFFYGVFGGGLFSGFGFGSLVGGIGAIIVIVAGVALLRANPVR